MEVIATIENDFTSKFAIPRQSLLAPAVESTIVFTPKYRNPDAVRGLSDYSYIWLIFSFSDAKRRGNSEEEKWAPTVRPPRLGGNERVGVFASRSPYRPNSLGLSSVRLLSVDLDQKLGPVLKVAGADLMNHTPIYDIKPYLPYTDAHPDAKGGFTDEKSFPTLTVECPDELLRLLPEKSRKGFLEILREDPRPAYQKDPDRVYGFSYAGFEIRFKVKEQTLTVLTVSKRPAD